MPAPDWQREVRERAGPVADGADNPLHDASGAGVEDLAGSHIVTTPTGRALREVLSTEFISNALFLGADALVLVQFQKITLHSLTDAGATPVLLVAHSAGETVVSSAASRDGEALCGGTGNGWVAVFDVTALMAEPLSPPRHEAQLGTGIAGVAFSDDGARLLTMYAAGAVEVRDADAEGLALLRTLAFCGPYNAQGSCFLHCAGGLAVAVGGGLFEFARGAQSRRARVWHLSPDGEDELATLELTAFASAAAVRGDGGEIAVGGADGVVRLFGGEGWAQSAELAEPGDSTVVRSLAYTPDGRQLVVGRQSDAFVVYDVGSRASVGRFVESTSEGWVLAIAPAGDAVAIGGLNSKAITLRELVPVAPLCRWAMHGGDTLAGAQVMADIIALAMGSRLEVRSRGSVELALILELGVAVGCFDGINNPVAVRPGGGHVACAVGPAKAVTCRVLPSGAEAFALVRADIGGSVVGLRWSPGGDLLLVWGGFGVAMFDATGAKQRMLSDDGQVVWGAAFSTDGARLATAGGSNKIFVRDTDKWEVMDALPMGGLCQSPCFDPAGECVAVWVSDGSPTGSVVVHQFDGSAPDQRFLDVTIHGIHGTLAFSADGGFLYNARHNHMVILSRATGAEADWSTTFTAMALSLGTLNGGTLAVPIASGAGAAGLVRLQVVVGSSFVEIDVGLARRAIEDNAWGYERLVQLTDTVEPRAVGALIGGAPHCLNIRDTTTGDTLLHYCANTGNVALAVACLAPEAAVFVPIANHEGKTALQTAFEQREPSVARLLAESLTPHLNDAMSVLLTSALAAAALTMPEVVLALLNAIEPMVLVKHVTMRTRHHRTEVIGLAAPALTAIGPGAKDPDTFESEREGTDLGSATSLDLAPWNEKFPSTDQNATHTLVAFKALLLADFAGDPADIIAFHTIVANCDASVFESKVLQLVVQYKFETNVLPTLRQAALLYTGATLLASAATLASSRQLEGGWEESNLLYIHVGQGMMVVAELASLFAEARQLAKQDIRSYFTSPWNLMDVGASVALIVGAVGHFERSADTVHLFGALGVALKWFSAERGSPIDPERS
jgi:WD40 repeat protein